MNASSIFNIRRKKTLNLLMSYLPKVKKLEISQKNKRLQKALKIREILYEVYSLPVLHQSATYNLNTMEEDEYTKKEVLNSLFEIANLPFFNGIGFTLEAHSKRITSICTLPPMKEGDKKIASFSWDNTIKIWDLNTQSLYLTLPPVKQEDIIIALFPLYTMKDCKSRRAPILLRCVTWDKDIIDYDLRKNTVVKIYHVSQYGKLLCAITIGNYLYTSSYEKEIKVWEMIKNNYECIKVLSGHTDAVPKMIKLNNNKMASCSWDKSIRIWNENFECESVISCNDDKIVNMIQLKDGRLAVCILEGSVNIINMNKKVIEMSFLGNSYLYQLEDGRIVTGLKDTSFQIVNLEKKVVELVFNTNHTDCISAFLQLEDGRIITSSFDKKINVYGFVTKKELIDDVDDYNFTYDNNCLYIDYIGSQD